MNSKCWYIIEIYSVVNIFVFYDSMKLILILTLKYNDKIIILFVILILSNNNCKTGYHNVIVIVLFCCLTTSVVKYVSKSI